MRPTNTRWYVLVMLCLAAAAAYLSRNCLGVAVAEKKILTDLDCSRDEMGLVMGVGFFFSYAIFQIPGGWLGNRLGSRRVLTLFAIAWAIPTAIMSVTIGFYTILVTYLMIGVAQAGLFPNSADSISKWFPSSRTAFACGSLGSAMSVGAAVAVFLSGVLIEYLGWRWMFAIFAVPAVVWGVAFFWWFRDRPEQHSSVNDEELAIIRDQDVDDLQEQEVGHGNHEKSDIPWATLLASMNLWMICGQQFFRAAGYIFYSTWFPTYLRVTKNVSAAESGILSSLPLLAVVLGGIVGGLFVDKLMQATGSRRLSRQVVGTLSMAMCALFILAAYFLQSPIIAVLLITGGSFCATLAGPCASALTIETAGNQVPVTFSIMNMVGNIGAAVCPIAVSQVVKMTDDWEVVLILFVGIYLAGAACWVFINPNKSIVTSDEQV